MQPDSVIGPGLLPTVPPPYRPEPSTVQIEGSDDLDGRLGPVGDDYSTVDGEGLVVRREGGERGVGVSEEGTTTLRP